MFARIFMFVLFRLYMYDMDNVYVCIVLTKWSNKNKFFFFFFFFVIYCLICYNSSKVYELSSHFLYFSASSYSCISCTDLHVKPLCTLLKSSCQVDQSSTLPATRSISSAKYRLASELHARLHCIYSSLADIELSQHCAHSFLPYQIKSFLEVYTIIEY